MTEIKRLMAALLLSPTLAVLSVFVIPFLIDEWDGGSTFLIFLALIYHIEIMVITVFITFLYVLPASELLLRDKNKDGYLNYTILGLIPSVIFAQALPEDPYAMPLLGVSLQLVLLGPITALIFRWIRGGITDGDGGD